MSRISPAQFREQFSEVLDPADEVVVVYSGIWTFGHQFGLPIRDVPRMLIEQMLEAVGPDRTLVLPSYTYAYAGKRSYSPQESLPETGVLPQAYWREFPVTRTESALNSSNVMVLPMHVNDGRSPNWATLSSNTSRTDAYSLTSISAGTPFG